MSTCTTKTLCQQPSTQSGAFFMSKGNAMNIEDLKKHKAEAEQRIANLIKKEIVEFEKLTGVQISECEVYTNQFDISTVDSEHPKLLNIRKVSLKTNL